MKQVLRRGLKDIVVDEVPDPVVIPHHVLVAPLYSLISSGTETASIHTEGVLQALSHNPSHLRKLYDVAKSLGPIKTFNEALAKLGEYAVLGYSGAGVIVSKHGTVTDLEIGDQVAYGGEGTGHAETILAGRHLVTRVPETVPPAQACFTTIGSIALHASRIAAIALGEVVAVIGQGLVGQLVSQLARLQGGIVVASDLRPERVELARTLGADHAVASGEHLVDAVRAISGGRGVDCAIVAAAARSPEPCSQALRIVRDRGRIVVVGSVDMTFPWIEMYLKEVQLFMARAYGPGSYDPAYEQRGQDYPTAYVRWTENRNMEEFLRLVQHGRVQLDKLVTHQFPLAAASEAYRTIMDQRSPSLAVLLRYPAADATDPVRGFSPRRTVEVTRSSAPAPRRLRVAVVGAGNLTRWEHLPILRKSAQAAVYAVYSAAGARGKTYARRFGARYCTSEYEQILRDPDVDMVLIASRNQDHAWQAEAALRAGKHVFVEKPMALTEDECRALGRAVAESGRFLTVGFNRRFAPDYLSVRRKLESRSGPVVLNCRVNSPGISGSYWMADPAVGGAILGEACHFIDLMYWLLDAEPVSVFAHSLPIGKQEPVGENNLVASIRFADGSIGNLTYCTVGSKTSGGERLEVFAPGFGVASEDFKRVTVATAVRARSSRWWPEKGYRDQMEAVLGTIRQGRAPAVTVVDGARATVGCLRMLESARAQEPRLVDLTGFFV